MTTTEAKSEAVRLANLMPSALVTQSQGKSLATYFLDFALPVVQRAVNAYAAANKTLSIPDLLDAIRAASGRHEQAARTDDVARERETRNYWAVADEFIASLTPEHLEEWRVWALQSPMLNDDGRRFIGKADGRKNKVLIGLIYDGVMMQSGSRQPYDVAEVRHCSFGIVEGMDRDRHVAGRPPYVPMAKAEAAAKVEPLREYFGKAVA